MLYNLEFVNFGVHVLGILIYRHEKVVFSFFRFFLIS